MNSDRFDLLTRQLATGASRRQVLKGILGFAVGSLLANLGFKAQAASYLGIVASPAQEEPLYVPYLVNDYKQCTVASHCDDRKGKECGSYPDCYCIESAEGELRCGAIPTCASPFCETSADCAELGPGWFCDTPSSGCCDRNSEIKRTRCVPPCDGGCPQDKVCGANCCANGQTCAFGECVSDYDCDYVNYITPETMTAALAKLAAGETTADLSPQGCIKAHQKIVDDEVVSKSVTIGNVTVMKWEKVENQWLGQHDSDFDYFQEWRAVTTLDENGKDINTVETEYDPATQLPVSRTTITPQGETVHFLFEEAVDAGELQVVDEYDAPRFQVMTLGNVTAANVADSVDSSQQGSCEANPCNQQVLKQRMIAGIDGASNCLPDFGDLGLRLYMQSYNVQLRPISFKCETIPGDPEAAIEGWESQTGPLTITVDPAKYCPLNEEQREWILYHEVLHAAFQRAHDPNAEKLPEEQRKQLDRVYGCMAFCYNNKNVRTKCMCAKCLGKKTCDPLCAPFNSDCGATCPCPAKNNQYYMRCDQCLAGCPSGLNCAGYRTCNPVGHSSTCPPVTCP